MASFYWYERDPELLQAEKIAMARYFPGFRLEKLSDGKLCWEGSLSPRAASGGTWYLQAVYQHNHPDNSSYGGSIRVYSIQPDLNELCKAAERLPHILRDESGNFYMCTARMEDFEAGPRESSSAATSLGWAAKWIFVVEEWLDGSIGDEVFAHTF